MTCSLNDALAAELGVAYAVGAVVALRSAGVGIGMNHSVREVLEPSRRGGLFGRVALVDVLVLPPLVWVLIKLFQMPSGYATGLLLVGIAFAGPLGLKASQIAGADAVTALSLVVVLELANLAAIPLWSAVLLPADAGMDVNYIILPPAAVVLLPLVVGPPGGRRLIPVFSARLSPTLPTVANVGLVVAVGAVLLRDGDAVVRAAGERVPIVAALAVLAALALGWLAGGPDRETRGAAALVAGIRANTLALTVAASSFPGRPGVRAGVLVIAVFSITMPLAAAFVLGRKSTTPASQVALFIPAT